MRNLNDFHAEETPQTQEWVDLLNQSSETLSPEVAQGLARARQKAMQHYQAQTNTQMLGNGMLAWLSFGHPRMVSAGLLTLAIFAGIGIKQISAYTESGDAFLLSADLPPEAFVDNGFEPWLTAQSNI